MDNAAVEECRNQLHRLILRDGQEIMESQPWAMEEERWAELVFSVIAELTDLPEDAIRECVEELLAIGLLSISQLARPNIDKAGAAYHRRVAQAIEDAGVSQDVSVQVTQAVHEIAVGLQTHFDGYLQRYLRHYGEMMLADLEKWFEIKAITNAEVQNAFCYWLQNALLMPLSNIDGPVKAFCEDLAASPAELIEAADQLGANLSLLDDLLLLRWKAADTKTLERLLKSPQNEMEEVA